MAERSKTLSPPAGAFEPQADEILERAAPGPDPVEAAAQRAAILTDLHRHAPRDPRTVSVFEEGPIVALDSGSGNIVTRSMLTARLALFDTVLILLDRPPLSNAVRSTVPLTLKQAFPSLSEDAQAEWALSEVRRAEAALFLDQSTKADLNALTRQLAVTLDERYLWTAARAFTMVVHISTAGERGSALLPDLLEMRSM